MADVDPFLIISGSKTNSRIVYQLEYIEYIRNVWRHQRGNQAVNQSRTANTMVNRKRQKDKQWVTKHYTEN
jgi:hypothetical protein